MKKLIALLFLVFFITGTVMAQDWWVKPSAGVLIASVDDKIVWDDSHSYYRLEGYEGGAGTEIRLSVGASRLETSYILQYYTADKDGDANSDYSASKEKGELTFVNEMLEVAGYFFDEAVKTGFNISAGAGIGVSKLTLERTFDGVDEPDLSTYAKIYHYRGSAHYEITEMFGVEFTYRSENMNVADQASFTNTTMSLLANAKF
jgi:hypothetical protein